MVQLAANKFKVALMMSADLLNIMLMAIVSRYLVFGELADMPWLESAVFAFLQVAVLGFCRYYRIRIQDSSLELLYRTLVAALPVAVVFLAYVGLVLGLGSASFRWAAVFCIFYLISIMGIRVAYRYIKTQNKGRNNHGKPSALVYGAGTIGTTMASLNRLGKFDFNIVGFVDDDPYKAAEIIKDHQVLGSLDDLPGILRTISVSTLIVAITNIARDKMQKAVAIAKEAGIDIKVVPSLFELSRGKKELDLRSVNYEDLLGRPLRVIEREPVEKLVSGKTILVTGAGGSIGSEICTQLVTYPIKKIVLLDIDESELHDLALRLLHYTAEWSDAVVPVVCDIRNKDKLDRIFLAHKPDIVFHAAAYKHVPLMEKFPEEAVVTNMQGSYNVLEASRACEAKKVIVISTDKAVNPTNVMGATKRVVEMIASAMSTEKTPVCCVRFGNVIGSRGSMLPLFVEEIHAGVPITVTDKDIVRYFMAIPEAVSLVFRAATLASGGEVMVLDMGEPVNIYDFAQKLISLYGTSDNTIKITGLRPGEKLYEEVLASDDTTVKTVNSQIRKAVLPSSMTEAEALELLSSIPGKSPEELVALVKKTVPEFRHERNYC